ncbi:MAG: protein-L-isoaspartate(D-aspartate) O-methyltransferase [Brevefilum sp.]|nr:protein-L-isoaspartate(D-aspartate) O-methyltransferase [Brevefilum sp.]
MDPYQAERERMVAYQIASKGVKDEKVLAAMRKVPRHRFVSEDAQAYAYVDSPVRIGKGQTISQPYIVALMTELLGVQPEHRVLDVGTGSGYQAAILGELAAEVHSIERHPELAETARATLEALGYKNIQVHVGDGTEGYAPAAPYNRIIVAAAAPSVPQALLDQLSEGGRLVIPVGSRYSQQLEVWVRRGDQYQQSSNIPVVFVPLIGKQGWQG